MNLNTLVNDLCRDKKVVDMTNQLSHYNILNKENLMPFSSTYNTNNRVMQIRAIEVLQEKQPEILIVAPGLAARFRIPKHSELLHVPVSAEALYALQV